jgi:hypothetical protein
MKPNLAEMLKGVVKMIQDKVCSRWEPDLALRLTLA